MAIRVLLERLQLQMWFIPGLFAVGAIALAIVFVYIDSTAQFESAQVPFLFGGNAEGARLMLSTIATAMLTFTGLVFTVTMLVLQQASNQHSPRVLRTFLRDRKNQGVLGIFVATFLFTLVVLRQTRGEGGNADEFVPGLSIGAAFLLLLTSVGAFIFYIDHMANAVRATTILDNIAAETLSSVDRLFPDPVGKAVDERADDFRPRDKPDHVVTAGQSGVITAVDAGDLIKAASADAGGNGNDRADGGRSAAGSRPRLVEMGTMVGEYLTPQTVVFRAWGDWSQKELDDLADAVNTGPERTVQQDVAFGLRQLADVALRALSPAMNDPTTAVQALDRIHEVLQRLVRREMPSPVRRDDAGTVRLLLPHPGWDDFVLLAFEEIRLSGEHQLQVLRRLRSLIFSLLDAAPAHRQPVLRRQLGLLDQTLARRFRNRIDPLATAADADGGRATVKTLPG